MKKLLLLSSFCFILVGFTSCSDDGGPMVSERVAELIISFDPNPVTREVDDSPEAEFKCVYDFTISEVNNVGVTLSEMIIEGNDLSTGEVIEEIKDVDFIILVFGTNRVRPGNTLSNQFTSRFTLSMDDATVEITFTLSGVDDNGNEVSTSASVQCQP